MTLPTEKTKPKTKLADLTVLLYGPPKIGKSTWCSQAPGALFLATEPGLNSLEVFQVTVTSWPTLLESCKAIVDSEHKFKTVVIDTVDNAYKFCSAHVCEQNGVKHESELGYGKGFALVNNEFQRVLNRLAQLPTGLFLVSHAVDREFETRTGKYTKSVPTLPNRAREIVLGLADMVLFADLEAEAGKDGKSIFHRVIRTAPHLNYEAGDRTGRLPETIDLDFGAFRVAFEGGKA
jgi:hypothetical protein